MRTSVLEAFREEANELLRKAERVLHGATGRALSGDDLLALRRILHTLKGSAAAAGESALEQRCHALEERLLAPEGERDGLTSDELFASLAALRAASGHALPEAGASLEPLPEDAPAEVPRGTPPASPGAARASGALELLRVRPERVDQLHGMVGDLVVARLEYESAVDRMADAEVCVATALDACKRLLTDVAALRRSLPDAAFRELQSRAQNASATVQVGLRAMSTARRAATVARAQAAAATAEVDDAVRELRLMPLEPFFEDYANAVREAARECGKVARLSIRAHGVEVDRAVLARLREPLVHLVRNAVVHGLESATERERIGKDAVGVIALEARTEGSRAILRVGDDGRGIDEARVREKAAALGLVDGSQPLDDRALLDLITHPGLSTRERADALAGRGMGLNVVADVVRELNGHLHLDTFEGAGCVFSIDVPITASTGSGLVVECGGTRLGLLLAHIERIVRVDPAEIVSVDGRETVRLEKDPVGLVRLGPLIGLEEATSPSSARRPGIVLRSGHRRIVLQVDDVIGEHDLVIKPLGDAFAGADFLLGGAIQADGGILPVLHIPALFSRAATKPRERTERAQSPETGRARGSVEILVVDDSITMRTLERNILEAAGYVVRVAHDGVAALEDIRAHGAPSLVVTDLEMPRMDGCGLCAAIRASDEPDTPILIVTSVDREAEKTRALEAGADAYIVKGDFEQGRFLDLVHHLTGALGTAA